MKIVVDLRKCFRLSRQFLDVINGYLLDASSGDKVTKSPTSIGFASRRHKWTLASSRLALTV